VTSAGGTHGVKEGNGALEYHANLTGKYAPGDYVKAEFHEDSSGHSEWMWVRVERSDDADRLLLGSLTVNRS
jgi:hypothetical protein